MHLVIVESPAKAKTIAKFLGPDYSVIASYGHIRDLPKSELGVAVDHDFMPTYEIPPAKQKYVKAIRQAAKGNTDIFIATDEDREGEAIGWHILRALKLKNEDAERIVFHEITKQAIQAAISHPRKINQDLVDAQQARRILDRIVGYKLSPFLWKKIRYGLSAGRVQSVAVRLIVEREREIQEFKPVEYWEIHADLQTPRHDDFTAELVQWQGKKLAVDNKKSATSIVDYCQKGPFTIQKVTKKEAQRKPPAPFTTSTLQQGAHHKIGFSVKRTMMIAQKLYEGISLGVDGIQGLITYMRTDSTNLATQALQQARQVIEQHYGAEYLPAQSRTYQTKSKSAQEAHEAIRPVNLTLTPESVAKHLSKEQLSLYTLIWNRTIASQMANAVLDKTTVDIACGKEGTALFRANGQIIQFAGFMKAYTQVLAKEVILPDIHDQEKLKLLKLTPDQHFTKPKPRYNEASLVKKLEAEGIGRPSTYVPIITTIIARGYVTREEKKLVPTETGFIVNDFLVEHFPDIVDYTFTAKMEQNLDDIASGKKQWVTTMQDFYKPFIKNLELKEKQVQKGDAIKDTTEEICKECSAPMQVKFGKRGKFLACSKYPDCKYTQATAKEQALKDKIQEMVGDTKCDKCGKPMLVKTSRYGTFLGCSGYPDCKNIQKIQIDTGVACGACDKGTLVERKTRRGKTFYSCNRYPKCDYATWDLQKPGKCTGQLPDKK